MQTISKTFFVTALSFAAALALAVVSACLDGTGFGLSPVAAAPAGKKSKGRKTPSPHSILVMVNDDPITLYDVNLRASFMALQQNIGKAAQARFKRIIRSPATMNRFKQMQRDVIKNNRGKSRDQLIKIFRAKQKRYAVSLQKRAISRARSSAIPQMRAKALKELIEESLKLQAAKKLNVVVSKAEVDKVVASMAKRNKQSPAQFAAHLKRLGSNISTMRSRMKAGFAWRRMINRRYGAIVSINDAQIDSVITSAELAKGKSGVKLQLQRITLGMDAKDGQRAIAARLLEAEHMGRKFRTCKTMSRLTKGVANARFEKLGLRAAGDIAEPTRTMLLSANDGQIMPPTLASNGIVLYAICGRKAGRGDDKQRAAAKGKLRAQEYDALARRHMRDLRAEARICRRQSAAYTRTIAPCL